MAKQIINQSDLEFKPFPAPMPDTVKAKFEGVTLAFIAPLIGGKKLGYNIAKVPPGKRAFPFHSHRVNEEMFFVLEGEGEVRIGNETFKIKKGDFMAHPPGGPETAHQIINTGTNELVYLGVSTSESPEIADYPETKKFGILAENFRFLGRAEDSLGYFDGE